MDQIIKNKIEKALKGKGMIWEKLQGDASTRQYFRVGKKDSSSKIVSLYPKELRKAFRYNLNITSFLHKQEIPVPEVLRYSKKNLFAVLEDLGDDTLYSLSKGKIKYKNSKFRKLYLAALDYLKIFAEHHKGSSDGSCIALKYKFTPDKFMEELDGFTKYFLFGLQSAQISPEDRKKIRALFGKLSRSIAKHPYIFVHRDYHSRNIMVKKGRPYLIDFQDARLGPYLYDICSLLEDPYVTVEKKLKKELLEDYFNFMNPKLQIDKETFLVHYAEVASQRLLKAIGTYAKMTFVHRKSFYLKFISPALNRLKRMQDTTPILKEINKILKKYKAI